MGQSQKNKIKLEKVTSDDIIHYIIDYSKQKEPDEYFINLIQDFAEGRVSLLVIDTDYFYPKNNRASENRVTGLTEEFDKQGIVYRKIVIKKEDDYTLLGFRLKTTEKVNHYKVGVAVLPDQIRKVTELVKDSNLFYYITSDDMDSEKLLELFVKVRGEYEDLAETLGIYIFNDCSFHRIRINSGQGSIRFTEEKLAKYQ